MEEALVTVVFDTPEYDVTLKLECPIGMPMQDVFVSSLQAFARLTMTKPGERAFRFMTPSHLDGVATYVSMPCIIHAHAIDASGIPFE